MRFHAHPWAMALFVLIAPIEVAARGTDPRVPPGTDPGGTVVALISTGIDYTLPHIAPRLARDGEGEIIGWDFADDDALPYGPAEAHGTEAAGLLLAESPEAKLIPVRIKLEQPASLSRALAFVGRTPARVALISGQHFGPEHRELLGEAALHLGHLLIVVGGDESGSDQIDSFANVLTVGAEDSAYDSEPKGETQAPGLAAAARAAALASEIAAREPYLDGAGLKRAVVERLD